MNARSTLTVSLLVATISNGLMAGVFGIFSHTVMRGLHNTDDRTFVGAFQAIDRAIINPIFISTFLGALGFSALASALSFRDGSRSVLPWVIAATVLYLAVVITTSAVHLPLNDAMKAAGRPDDITALALVRANFHETRWIAWNIVRTVASTAAFVCLAWALLLHGRATGDRTTQMAHALPATDSPRPSTE